MPPIFYFFAGLGKKWGKVSKFAKKLISALGNVDWQKKGISGKVAQSIAS